MFVVILDSLKFKKYVTYIKLHAIKVRSNIYWKHFDFVKGISKQDEKYVIVCHLIYFLSNIIKICTILSIN